MKNINLLICLFLGGILMISSCDLLKKDEVDPDKTIAKEGNMWEVSATGYPSASATVTTNDKGVATFKLTYDGYDYTFKGKVTEKKIEDYFYSSGDESKPFTLCDFDAKVGDKWEYNLGTAKVVREVTHKSTDDDTFVPGLYLMVKVTEVEETIPDGLTINGNPAQAKKILWKFNHKFGFVGAVITKTDNTTVPLLLTDTNVGLD